MPPGRPRPNPEPDLVKSATVMPQRRSAWAIAAIGFSCLGAFSSPARAFGFGEPQVASSIGQPLRLRIPVRVDTEGELTAQCVRLIGSSGADAVPTITMAMARIMIERKGEDRILRIDSTYPINEPVLRVSVEAGCAQHARREFVLLLDPPDTAPRLALATPGVTAAVAAGAPAAESTASLASGVATAPAGAGVPDAGPALVLGDATVTGHTGTPLSLLVPVSGSGAAALDAACVRLAGTWTGEGPPVLSQARVTVVRSAAGSQIDLATDNPVTAPTVRVVLEAGCAGTARREYTIALDAPAPADAQPSPVASPPPAMASAGEISLATRVPSGTARAAAPARPPVAHPPLPNPSVPVQVAAAPAQTPASASAAAPPPARSPPSVRAKAAPPAADRLVLAAPADQPDPAAQRIAEMDKRIADLTHEVALLRDELAADRQRALEASPSPTRLGAGWIVAILALLGMGILGLMNLQRKRSGMPWEKNTWEPNATVIPDAPERTRMTAMPPTVPVREAPAAAAAPPPPLPAAPPPPPPLPRDGPLAAFDELTGTTSTLTPDPRGPQTRIEVTELHADDPELGTMHTVFLEPGNFDGALLPPTGPIETRIPGPAPAPAAFGTLAEEAPAAPPSPTFSPIVELPPMPAPTVVAPDHRHGAFTFDEGPYTQTPTMLVLDLDLSTRALPPEEAEIARFSETAQKVKDGKGAEVAAAAETMFPEPRTGYKNGH